MEILSLRLPFLQEKPLELKDGIPVHEVMTESDKAPRVETTNIYLGANITFNRLCACMEPRLRLSYPITISGILQLI